MFTFTTEEMPPAWLLALALSLWFAAQVYVPGAAACLGSWRFDGVECWCEMGEHP